MCRIRRRHLLRLGGPQVPQAEPCNLYKYDGLQISQAQRPPVAGRKLICPHEIAARRLFELPPSQGRYPPPCISCWSSSIFQPVSARAKQNHSTPARGHCCERAVASAGRQTKTAPPSYPVLG